MGAGQKGRREGGTQVDAQGKDTQEMENISRIKPARFDGDVASKQISQSASLPLLFLVLHLKDYLPSS